MTEETCDCCGFKIRKYSSGIIKQRHSANCFYTIHKDCIDREQVRKVIHNLPKDVKHYLEKEFGLK